MECLPWDGAGELERSWRRRPPAGERHLQGSCLQSVRGRGAVLNSRRSFCPPSKLEAASEAFLDVCVRHVDVYQSPFLDFLSCSILDAGVYAATVFICVGVSLDFDVIVGGKKRLIVTGVYQVR